MRVGVVVLSLHGYWLTVALITRLRMAGRRSFQYSSMYADTSGFDPLNPDFIAMGGICPTVGARRPQHLIR